MLFLRQLNPTYNFIQTELVGDGIFATSARKISVSDKLLVNLA
jgi:hypothetical protein